MKCMSYSGLGLCLCYKSCGNYIITMKKLPDTICNECRKDIVDPLHAKFRADKLYVICIEHKKTGKKIDRIQHTSYPDKKVWYEESKEVFVPDYGKDIDKVYGQGIYYYLSRDVAYYCGNRIKDGLYRSWYDNGQKKDECTYVAGKKDGLHQLWYEDGQKNEEWSVYLLV